MKRIALSLLTAAVSATAFAPMAFAAPDFNQLRRENLDKHATTIDEIRRENLEKSGKVDFDQLRQENLDKVDFGKLREENLDKVDFGKLREENLDKGAVDFDQLR